MRTSPSGWGCREGGGRGVDAPQIRASGGKTVDTPAGECSPAAPWVTPNDLAAQAVRRCCQGNVGGAQSRSEETARSQGAAGARRKTEGKWPPHAASGGPPADACGVALRATGPFSVRCRTPSLKRAPAGSGRSRDRLKLRPQLLGGVRMAGLEPMWWSAREWMPFLRCSDCRCSSGWRSRTRHSAPLVRRHGSRGREGPRGNASGMGGWLVARVYGTKASKMSQKSVSRVCCSSAACARCRDAPLAGSVHSLGPRECTDPTGVSRLDAVLEMELQKVRRRACHRRRPGGGDGV